MINDNPALGWPHNCASYTRSWIRTSDTQFKIICSWCKKPYGWWNFTFAKEEPKVYPQDTKYDTEQKKNWK